MKYLIGILTLWSRPAVQPTPTNPDIIPLDGPWEFATDHRTGALRPNGTTDTGRYHHPAGHDRPAAKGFFNNDSSASPIASTYEGPAWYRRKVIVPRTFDKRIFLHLNAPKVPGYGLTEGKPNSRLLQSPQRFEVTHMLDPGEHTLTLRIDNRLRLPLRQRPYISNDTQTNWNGILGEMFLLARDSLHINIWITPDITAGTANAVDTGNPYPRTSEVEIQVERTCKGAQNTSKAPH